MYVTAGKMVLNNDATKNIGETDNVREIRLTATTHAVDALTTGGKGLGTRLSSTDSVTKETTI